VGGVLLLVEVASDEALHGCGQRRALGGIAEYLQIDAGEVMIGIGVELALVLG
jgi:hypothetical protein